jgi:hypothetical protein
LDVGRRLWRRSTRAYAKRKAALAALLREVRFEKNPPARFLDAIERSRASAAATGRETQLGREKGEQARVLWAATQAREGGRLRQLLAAILARFIDEAGSAAEGLTVEIGELDNAKIAAGDRSRVALRYRGRLIVQMNIVVWAPWESPGRQAVLWASFDDDSLARLLGIERDGPDPDWNPRRVLGKIALYVAHVVNGVAILPGGLLGANEAFRPSASFAGTPRTGLTS